MLHRLSQSTRVYSVVHRYNDEYMQKKSGTSALQPVKTRAIRYMVDPVNRFHQGLVQHISSEGRNELTTILVIATKARMNVM